MKKSRILWTLILIAAIALTVAALAEEMGIMPLEVEEHEHFVMCSSEDKTVCYLCGEAHENMRIEHGIVSDKVYTNGKDHWWQCSCGDREFDRTEHSRYCDEDRCLVCNATYTGDKKEHRNLELGHDQSGHWYQCVNADCGDIVKQEEHSRDCGQSVCSSCPEYYDGDRKTHALSKYGWDENGHWQECFCGEEKGEPVAHSVTCLDPDHCKRCGAEVSGIEPTHSGSSSGVYESDSSSHWLICDECGKRYNEGAHRTSDGAEAGVCAVCDREFGSADPSPSVDPEATDDPNATTDPEGTKDPEGTPDPEGTKDPESTPDPEGTQDPEGTKDPEGTPDVEGTPDPEGTKEPEGTHDPEETPEPADTPEPEIPDTPEETTPPEVQLTPEVTMTPEVTSTPEITPTPEVSPVPEESSVPEETATPEPTEAPEEMSTPDVTDTPEPTEAPEATDAPQETEAPVATDAPQETATPDVTDAPQETATPEATATPAPTATPTRKKSTVATAAPAEEGFISRFRGNSSTAAAGDLLSGGVEETVTLTMAADGEEPEYDGSVLSVYPAGMRDDNVAICLSSRYEPDAMLGFTAWQASVNEAAELRGTASYRDFVGLAQALVQSLLPGKTANEVDAMIVRLLQSGFDGTLETSGAKAIDFDDDVEGEVVGYLTEAGYEFFIVLRDGEVDLLVREMA